MPTAIRYIAVRVAKFAAFLLAFCIISKADAQKVILLSDSTSLVSIGKQVDLLEDPEGKLSLEQILSSNYQSQFKRSSQDVPNYGIKQTTVWCRMKIKSSADKDWMLNVDFPNLRSVILFQAEGDKFIEQRTGRSFALRNRPVENRSFLFPLKLKAGEEKEIYLRLENHICVFPLYIGSMVAVSEKQYPENILHGVFYGIAVIIVFYALALFIATREIYYLYFFLQVIFFATFCMIYYGEAAHWFPRFAIGLADYGTVIISLGIICVYLFFDGVLKTKRKIPWVSKAFMGSAALIGLGIILYFIGLRAVVPIINMFSTFSVFFLTVFLCFYLKEEKIVRLIFAGFCIGFVGIVFWVFMEKNMIRYTPFINDLFMLESMWWMITFSVALELNINNYIKEKYQAQKALLINMEEKEKLVLQQKEMLEQKVEERTRELRNTQAQLVQREKMASLGELTAGIAHGIQNPLNFITNFSEVSSDMLDEMKAELAANHSDAVTLIADEVKENLQKIIFHGKRVDAIVKGMLQHSQKSSGKKELTDINDIVDEYLHLCYHGLQGKNKTFDAVLETDYDNTVGHISVVPEDFVRVLVNIFNNSFYAVGEKKKLQQQLQKEYKPLISVTTKKVEDKIEIKIADNGVGIPQNVIDKIFQPFFTTKPTGKGTGLGLSLSYDVIKAHGGEIKVESKEGEGAVFTILLPIDKAEVTENV